MSAPQSCFSVSAWRAGVKCDTERRMNRRVTHRSLIWLALLPAIAIAGCREIEAPDTRDSESPLEIAARQAGVISDSDLVDPMGSYARRHENGVHEICIGPERRNSRSFGMIADLGEGLLCQGTGRVTGSGDRLRFDFRDDRKCLIDAHYDGQSIRLLGKLPTGCAALCSARATFAGLSVLRSGWSRGDARKVRARRSAKDVKQGQSLCR